MAAKVGPKLTTSRKQGENGRCGTCACGRGSGGGRRRGRRVGGRCKEGKKRNRWKLNLGFGFGKRIGRERGEGGGD